VARENGFVRVERDETASQGRDFPQCPERPVKDNLYLVRTTRTFWNGSATARFQPRFRHTLPPIANRAEHPRRAGRKPGRRTRSDNRTVIGPFVAADRCPVRATIIRAVDQETANASRRAHLGEGDFLLWNGHALLKRRPGSK